MTDYEWPFPQKVNTMSLQTIGNKNQALFREKSSLNIDDIEGSKPQLRPYRYTNKESFQNRSDDIEGTKSRQLIKSSNRQDLQLYNSDIKGSHPQKVQFVTGRQSSNPLEPVYKLPAFQQVEPIQNKFLRDSIQVHDIHGAKPQMQSDKLKKTPYIYEDIDGSHPKQRFIPNGRQIQIYQDYVDSMAVKDINTYMLHKSTRVTNPLEPEYIVRDEDGNKMTVGQVDGSRTKQLHPIQINKFASSSLATQDIHGAQAGTHSQQFLRYNERKDYRSTNNVKDIEGVSAGSLKKGITTIRQLNPLQPAYQIPGSTEILYINILIQVRVYWPRMVVLLFQVEHKNQISFCIDLYNQLQKKEEEYLQMDKQHEPLEYTKIDQLRDSAEIQYDKSCYESCLSCCGSCSGCLRSWLPCCCCCFPYPYYIIQQGNVGLVQEFGRYKQMLPAGMHIINPCTDSVLNMDMKTFSINIDNQVTLSKDNITTHIDAVVYYRIFDPISAAYRVQDLKQSIYEITYSVLRQISGEHTIQQMLQERIRIDEELADMVLKLVQHWGIIIRQKILGVYVEKIFIKDQRLTADITHSLALAGITKKFAEAKIINAQGNVEAAKFQREASDMLASKAAMQIRQLEMIQQIAKSPSHKVLMMSL
ncbi:hypothetical protein pb186bvf_001673 [Paramecium bursaria]